MPMFGTNNILNTISTVPTIPGAWTKYSCSSSIILLSVAPIPILRVRSGRGLLWFFLITLAIQQVKRI